MIIIRVANLNSVSYILICVGQQDKVSKQHKKCIEGLNIQV